MKVVLSVTALALAISMPGHAAEGSPSHALARAMLDTDLIAEYIHAGIQEKLQRCVKAGFLTQEKLAARQGVYARYEAAFDAGMPQVQGKLATTLASMLSSADMRQIAAAYSTPGFRKMNRETFVGMAQSMAPRIAGCGDEDRPITTTQIGSEAIKHITPAELARFRIFAVTPAAQHFRRVMPRLMPIMMDAFREDVANALHAVGGSGAMIDAARALASPVVLDPAPPATP